MRKLWTVLTMALAISTLAMWTQAAFAQEDPVARGKYLVEEVAKCQECHTARMDNGSYIKSQWMKGTTLNITPASPVAGWHALSPDVTPNGALWKRWGDEGMVAFLETGRTPRGGKASPPMPEFTLKHEDAVAVVAFLKTLQ